LGVVACTEVDERSYFYTDVNKLFLVVLLCMVLYRGLNI